MEYRDPLFGIIILFCIVFVIAFANYWWGVFRARGEEQSIEKFIKKFEVSGKADAYKELLNSFKLSTESLSLLAHTYVKSGDFEMAIGIYLIALKQVKGRLKKRYILLELAKAYFKAGFLQRSAEVFLESLRSNPRDKIALKYLTVCYEKLKTYDLALDALDALEELEVDVKMEKAFIRAKIILEDEKLKKEKKVVELKKLRDDFELIDRMIIEYKYSFGLLKASDLQIENSENIFDFVWFLDEEEVDISGVDDDLIKNIAHLKGQGEDGDFSGIFELEILNILKSQNYDKASLSFSFTCKDCKQSFPMFFYRCPNCHVLSSVKIEPVLINKNNETYIPFQ